MARRVSIPIVGDPTSFIRALRSSSNAASSFGRELKEVSVTAEKSAHAQVQAALKTDQRLRQEVRAYREVAASAKRGSREQVAAANLASRAEGRLARSVAVTARESTRHARLAGGAHQQIGRTARGALAGSGAFRSLGRSVAFASSYFLGGYGLFYGLRRSVAASSDLEEQVSKTDVVFGRSARGIIAWARTTATSFGISQRAALTYAGTFGALLRPIGLSQRRSAGLSRGLVERAADLASFYNTSEADSLAALQSGLVGQVRPLRRYGVQLSADRMKAIAFSTGIAKPDVNARAVAESEDRVAIAQVKVAEARKKHGANSVEAAQAALALKGAEDQLHASLSGSKSALTDQQKVLARIAIIMKDSKLAHGDFARTSSHLAQQQKILSAQLENETEQVGRKLTPMVLHYVTSLNHWLSKSENQHRVTNAISQAVSKLATGVRIASRIISVLANAAGRVSRAVGGWQNAFKIILAGVLVSKLAKVAARLHDIYKEAQLARGIGGAAGAGTGVLGLYGALAALSTMAAITIDITVRRFIEDHSGGTAGKILGGAWKYGISPMSWFHRDKALFDLAFGRGGKPKKEDVTPTAAELSDRAGHGVHGALRANAARQRAAAKQAGDEVKAEETAKAQARAAARRQAMLAHERAVRAASAREGRQMRLLGYGPTGSALTPTKAALKRELGTVSQAIKGTFLDTGEHRSLLSKIRRLLSGQLGALSADVRSKVKELLDGLKGQMNDFDGFNLAAADRRRRSLDRRYADRYRSGHTGVTGTGPGGSVRHIHHHRHSYDIKGHPGETNERMIGRAHWRLRTALT